MGISEFIYRLLGWKILAEAKIDGKRVFVVRKRDCNVLVYDHVIHSMLKHGKIYTGHYWDYFLPLPSAYNKPRVLVIGLGGGTMPFQIKKLYGRKAKVDAVEKSAEMVRLSKAFLPERLDAKIIVGDGEDYLATKENHYDVIILDTYIGGSIPRKFLEKSFVEKAGRALSSHGVFAINYAFTPETLARRPNLLRQLKSKFRVSLIGYPGSAGNTVIICTKGLTPGRLLEKISANFPRDKENSVILKAYSKSLKV